MSKTIEEEENYSIKCLLENYSIALIEIPESGYDDAFEELEQKIKSEEFFNAEQYGGSIEISGVFVDALNCKKVVGFIY